MAVRVSGIRVSGEVCVASFDGFMLSRTLLTTWMEAGRGREAGRRREGEGERQGGRGREEEGEGGRGREAGRGRVVREAF